jgi:glutathione S-transferase
MATTDSTSERLHLVGLHHSPWTERARWALDHHVIAHTYEEYRPILGELGLRVRTRALRGKLTVPVLFAPDAIVRESLGIVRYADLHGRSHALVPSELERDVLAWNERAEAAFAAGRGLYIRALTSDPTAVEEMAPKAIPATLRGGAARMGMALFKRKHDLARRSMAGDEAAIASALDALRAALRGDYVLGRFTLADLAMALTLQHVFPVSDAYIHLTDAERRCAEHNELAHRYRDIVAWRDMIYARHRRPNAAADAA